MAPLYRIATILVLAELCVSAGTAKKPNKKPEETNIIVRPVRIPGQTVLDERFELLHRDVANLFENWHKEVNLHPHLGNWIVKLYQSPTGNPNDVKATLTYLETGEILQYQHRLDDNHAKDIFVRRQSHEIFVFLRSLMAKKVGYDPDWYITYYSTPPNKEARLR